MRRVHHLKMELCGVEFALVVADDRDRRVRRRTEDVKALRQLGHAVAVAHPHRIFLTLAPDAVEEGRIFGDGHLGTAELAVMPALHLATELVRHRLLAVANAEHRYSGVVYGLRRKWRVLVENRSGAAGEDDRLRLHFAEGSFGFLVGNDFGIDLFFPHPARNELGHLGTEIDDQNLVVHGRSMCPENGRLGHARAVRGSFLRALGLDVKCPRSRQPNVSANWQPS